MHRNGVRNLGIAMLVASCAMFTVVDAIGDTSLPEIPYQPAVHAWPGMTQLSNELAPAPGSGWACGDIAVADSAGAPLKMSACSAYDQDNLYVRFAAPHTPQVKTITARVKPSTPPGDAVTYDVVPPDEADDVRSWATSSDTASVLACRNTAGWCQLLIVPLTNFLDPEKRDTTYNLGVAASDTPTDRFQSRFRNVQDLSEGHAAWARAAYGTHIGPPPEVVTPNPVLASSTPMPAPAPLNGPITRRVEVQAHAFDNASNSAVHHVTADGIVGQSALILAPDRASIKAIVQPSKTVSDQFESLLECPDCAEYRDKTSGVLTRKTIGSFVKKLDVSALGIDDLLYDPATTLGPFDSSLTLGLDDKTGPKYSYRAGISQFHGTTSDGAVFNDVVLHTGNEWTSTSKKSEFQAYGTHVIATRPDTRTADTGIMARYSYDKKYWAAAEIATQAAPGAQMQNGVLGASFAPTSTSSASVLVGWQDSGPFFNPPDGTADSLFGTHGPIAALHFEVNPTHVHGAFTLDAFARRAIDATAVRRTNISATASYRLWKELSLTATAFNKPSAGSVLIAEGAKIGEGPTPADVARFKDELHAINRAAAQLTYSNAIDAADRAVFDHTLVEATAGYARSTTACQVRGAASLNGVQLINCAALPRAGGEFTGSFFAVTPKRWTFGIDHNAIDATGGRPRALGSQTVTDGFMVAAPILRCGSAYFAHQNVTGSQDPTKNGRMILGSLVIPLVITKDGGSTALRIEYKHREPIDVMPGNVHENSVNVQLVSSTAHYYGSRDVARCRNS
jgi:hypothetical protein